MIYYGFLRIYPGIGWLNFPPTKIHNISHAQTRVPLAFTCVSLFQTQAAFKYDDGCFTPLTLNDCLCSLVHILAVKCASPSLSITTSVFIWRVNRRYWITHRKIWARSCVSFPTTNQSDLCSQDNLLSHSGLWSVSVINPLKLVQVYIKSIYIMPIEDGFADKVHHRTTDLVIFTFWIIYRGEDKQDEIIYGI